jgi:His-Xaa-Ser system radical SAM maturase HxsC
MCPQPPVESEEDKTRFNLKLISLMDKDTPEIGITGGEPTLIGDELFVLIKQIQKHQPKAAISLLTNGVKFADKSYAMKLAMCKHHDLQIDVPIFSDIADEHNHIVGAKTFYKTVQGLYNLALFNLRIGLRIVIHKLTYKRLPQLADYIYHNFPFVSQVAFMQMEITGNADANLDELWIDPYDYNEELRQAVLLLVQRGIRTFIFNAQLCVLPPEIREFAISSISDWKDTYLPECYGCKLRERCGGLFASNIDHHSAHINPNLEGITASACV